MKAQVVPYSSVVGQSIVLTDDKGAVIGQLALLNIQPTRLDSAAHKQRAIEIAKCVVERLNRDGPLRTPAPAAQTRQEIVEECARVAERYIGAATFAGNHIAEAIRALASPAPVGTGDGK